jgi:hypothetical protein
VNDAPLDPQKRKRPQARSWGGLRLLLIPVIVAAACYSGLWLLARFGSEWAMADQVPLPPQSQLLDVIYADYDPVLKTTFYRHEGSPETLRDWFVAQKAVPENRSYYETQDESARYSLLGYKASTARYTLYRLALYVTNSPDFWLVEHQACGGWTVFKDAAKIEKLYPEVQFDSVEGTTVFAIHLCVPAT